MNVVYKTVWTEYESGMGQRRDGVSYSLDKALLERTIRRIESFGDYACYSRAGEISQCVVDDTLLAKIRNYEVYTTGVCEDPGELGEFKPRNAATA